MHLMAVNRSFHLKNEQKHRSFAWPSDLVPRCAASKQTNKNATLAAFGMIVHACGSFKGLLALHGYDMSLAS